jgi:hypothetical protein
MADFKLHCAQSTSVKLTTKAWRYSVKSKAP